LKSKFVINYGESKRWIEHKLNKIWRDKRWELFKKYYKFEHSREVNIDKHCPPDIPKDHWALFVDYRLRLETLVNSCLSLSMLYIEELIINGYCYQSEMNSCYISMLGNVGTKYCK